MHLVERNAKWQYELLKMPSSSSVPLAEPPNTPNLAEHGELERFLPLPGHA